MQKLVFGFTSIFREENLVKFQDNWLPLVFSCSCLPVEWWQKQTLPSKAFQPPRLEYLSLIFQTQNAIGSIWNIIFRLFRHDSLLLKTTLNWVNSLRYHLKVVQTHTRTMTAYSEYYTGPPSFRYLYDSWYTNQEMCWQLCVECYLHQNTLFISFSGDSDTNRDSLL